MSTALSRLITLACILAGGRLLIQPNGVVTVDPEGPFSNAQCLTSLEGVSFGK